MSLFMTFLIGFCIGGLVGCDSPRTNTNTLPPIQPKKLRKYKVNKEKQIMNIINIVNIEGEPSVVRSYTKEAFLDRCNDKLHTNYTLEELNVAERAFLDKYSYLEIHESELITEYGKQVNDNIIGELINEESKRQ